MKKLIEKGEWLFSQGKIEEAFSCFSKALSECPSSSLIMNNLGVTYHAKGDTPSALEYLQRALKEDEENLDARINLANIYSDLEVWPKASEQIENCIASCSDLKVLPELYNRLGSIYMNMGRMEEAKKALIKSLQINSHQPAVTESLEALNEEKSRLHSLAFSCYKAAFAQIDITPSIDGGHPVVLQGLAGPPRRTAQVLSPLIMQLLMIEDVHFSKILIISSDLFGVGPEIVKPVRDIALSWGIDSEAIIINASHTHYAPGTISNAIKLLGPFYENYTKQISQTIVNNIPLLYNKLERCTIKAGTTEVSIGVNRRLQAKGQVQFAPNKKGYYLKHTPFLVLNLEESQQRIILLNHGCHPTGLGSLESISSDFPGVVRQEIVSSGEADAVMFLQGAAGDTKQITTQAEIPVFASNYEAVVHNGKTLASSILEGLNTDLTKVTGPIFCVRKSISIPLKPPLSKKKIKRLASDSQQNELVREWARSIIEKYPHGRLPMKLETELQLVSLGEKVHFVTLPWEPVAEIGKFLLSTSPHPNTTFILGYTNGLSGYLCTDEMLEDGGYEPEISPLIYTMPSPLAKGSAHLVISTAKRCFEEFYKRNVSSGYGSHHTTANKGKAFFTLSAGRCGTMTLAHILNTSKNARVWHHPQPDPIKQALLAFWGEIDKKNAFWKARSQIIHKSWTEGLIHGETDLLMTPFADVIAEEIPQAKFIVLVRDPRAFVRSGMRRNYYRGHPWDIGRLRPKLGTHEFANWTSLDQFEKICWLWKETYEYILTFINSLPKERYRIIKFEDIIRKPKKVKDVFEFLGLSGYDNKTIEDIMSKKLNAQTLGNFPPPEEWSDDLNEKLWKHCHKTAQKMGYTLDTPRTWTQNPQEIKLQQDTPPIEVKNKKRLLFLELPGTSTGGHLNHIVEGLKPDYTVRYHKTTEQREIISSIDWADIVWLEWANQMAIHVTNNVPAVKDKIVVCRLHGYEVFTDLPRHIKWEVVDHLIFVAKHKQEIFNRKFGRPLVPQSIIRNGVDLSSFSIPKNKSNTKKLVLLGHLNFRKGLPLLLHFYHELLKKDSDYYLYIRGEFQDPRLEMATYTMIKELNLENKLEFVGWVDNLNEWFSDKSHILSFSLEESFHYAIGNGMAAGLRPVIHAWRESREIWPEEFIFSNLEQFLALLEKPFRPNYYRKLLVENKLTKKDQIEKIGDLLQSLSEIIQAPAKIINGLHSCPPAGPVASLTQRHGESGHQDAATLQNKYCNKYVVHRPTGLLLTQDESFQEYMNLPYYLNNNSSLVTRDKALKRLQTVFHRAITSYFNTLNISRADLESMVCILGLLKSSYPELKIRENYQSFERLILDIYALLKQFLPRGNAKKTVEMRAIAKTLSSNKTSESIRYLYTSLIHQFRSLYERHFIFSFLIHGSLSTLDYTPFSDVDTQFFLNDSVFSSKDTLLEVARQISEANVHLRLFDPLQHHGFFISTQLDLTAYPEAFLPLATIENATAILGPRTLTFDIRSSSYENATSLWNLGHFFRLTFLKKAFPDTPFHLKRFLSRFTMLPLLYLEQFEGLYLYKRDALKVAPNYFPPDLWKVFETVTTLRKIWKPQKMLHINKNFYEQVFQFSEYVLEKLARSPHDSQITTACK